MLLRAHQLAGGEAGNAHLSVLPWHGAFHLPSSLKSRTIFMALTKQDGGAVRQKPVQELPTEPVRHLARVEVVFLFIFFHFFFPLFFCLFFSFFLVICCLYFHSLLFSKEFPWRTPLNPGFIMHRSFEMVSVPPMLWCSTIR